MPYVAPSLWPVSDKVSDVHDVYQSETYQGHAKDPTLRHAPRATTWIRQSARIQHGAQSRDSRLPRSQITPLPNLDVVRILLTSLQRLKQPLDGKQRHMPHLRRRTITVHRLHGMVDGSHTCGEPESEWGVHGEFGVVDDGAGRVVGVVDARFLSLFVGESGVSVDACQYVDLGRRTITY